MIDKARGIEKASQLSMGSLLGVCVLVHLIRRFECRDVHEMLCV